MQPSYVYPVEGLIFFAFHPKLWMKTICPFLLTLVFGIVSLVLSFVFLLPLQAHALINAHCPAWLAWLVSVIFVLIESAIIDIILFLILLPIFQDALFDATLRERNLDRMFETRVPVSSWVLCCRGMTSGLFLVWILLLAQILVLIITLPLHAIPVLGTFVACYINGWAACWGQRIHYDLEFRGFSAKESYQFARQHRDEYTRFGMVAVALELVPLANLLFMWTNVVGAALWVGDQYEEAERQIAQQHSTVPNGQPINKMPPPYPHLSHPYGAIPQ